MWTLADKYNIVTPLRAAEELVKKLGRFQPFIYRKATSRASIYIHFRGLPSGLTHKLRVSNHDEADKYGYKWSLRIDGVDKVRHRKLGRFYFEKIDELVAAFIKFYDSELSFNEKLMNGNGGSHADD